MQWTWVWVSSGSWWWTGRPVVLQSKASQELDTTVWLNWVELWVATEVVFWRQNCDVYNGTRRNMPAVYLHESCGYKRGWPVQVDQGYIVNYNLWVCLLSSFSRVWLFAAMWIIALSDSSAHEILQARILEWVAMPSFRGSSQSRDWTHISYVSCIGRWGLYHLSQLGSSKQF